MDKVTEISSDNESDCSDEIPFAERVAQKMPSNKKVIKNPKKTAASAFSDTDDEEEVVRAPRAKILKNDSLEITPPPICSPAPPVRSTFNFVHDQERDDVIAVSEKGKMSGLISGDSVGLSKKEMKEVEKKKREEDKQQKKKIKENQKQNSKAIKEAEKLVNKQTDKSEVNKYLQVLLDPALVSSPPGSEILHHLQHPVSKKPEHVYQYHVDNNLPVEGSLTWRRKIISFDPNQSEIQIRERFEEENRALVVIATDLVVEKISENSLKDWASSVKARFRDKNVTLLIYGFNEYFRSEKNARERINAANVRGENPNRRDINRVRNPVSKYDFEEALVRLSLDSIVDHMTFSKSPSSGWSDLAGTVFHQTRAVAEAPLKIKKGLTGSAGFNFWARADSRDCIDNKNLPEYWKQILMQVSSGAGLEKVSAIVSLYPSPAKLLSAYSRCGSFKECQDLLTNLEVRRTDNVLGGTRKVGPDISRKIYMVLTSNDPEQLLRMS